MSQSPSSAACGSSSQLEGTSSCWGPCRIACQPSSAAGPDPASIASAALGSAVPLQACRPARPDPEPCRALSAMQQHGRGLKVTSLFSGAGGLDVGLHQVRSLALRQGAQAAGARARGDGCAAPAWQQCKRLDRCPLMEFALPHATRQAGHELLLLCDSDAGARQVRPPPALPTRLALQCARCLEFRACLANLVARGRDVAPGSCIDQGVLKNSPYHHHPSTAGPESGLPRRTHPR